MQEPEMKTSMATTYRQHRPHDRMNAPNNAPIFGQIFGENKLHQSLSEMPAVPVKNALTLEDIERVWEWSKSTNCR